MKTGEPVRNVYVSKMRVPERMHLQQNGDFHKSDVEQTETLTD